jgi:TonB family protein
MRATGLINFSITGRFRAVLATTLALTGTNMRRFLQFLFTVAMGAALLYLFAGKSRPRNPEPKEAKETARETVKEAAQDPAPGPDTLAAMDPTPPILETIPETGASGTATDTLAGGKSDSSGVRSTEAILSVIRRQTPALRHVYNAALRIRPGMKGKIVLKLRIAPSGALADVALVTSTTRDEAFDKAVAAKVATWRFKPVSGGADDIVTVPFTFSE